MLTCKKAAESVLDFLENSLSPEQQRAMRQHMQGCMLCEQFVESYKKTSVLCKKVLDGKAPAEMGQRLLDFLRRETRKP
jgi:RecJ-like exonuclease